MIIPSESVDASMAAARRYRARYLILERDHLPPWCTPDTVPEDGDRLALVWQIPPPEGADGVPPWRARVYEFR